MAKGRPKGTGSIELTLNEVKELIGSNGTVPVLYKWVEKQRNRQANEQAAAEQAAQETLTEQAGAALPSFVTVE